MASKKMALIASKGTLDMAYPPFILASTAAALEPTGHMKRCLAEEPRPHRSNAARAVLE